MTPKERFLTVLKGGIPDCVPASPDMSNMIPCKMTGRPFWDIYLHNDPPRHIAYLEVLRKYRHEGAWETHCPDLELFSTHDRRELRQEIVSRTDERITVRDICRTPDGELWQETVYYRDNPPTTTRKWVKDFPREFPIFLKHFFPPTTSSDDRVFQDWKARVGESGIVSLICRFPGYQDMMHYVDGNMEATAYSFYDYPALWEQYREVYHEYQLDLVRRQIAARPDFVFLTASGTLTLQSPEVFRRFGLPTVRAITRMCREAGVPTMLHSCGLQTRLVKMCAEETDLTAINPLEIPPMGDCNLADLKKRYGYKAGGRMGAMLSSAKACPPPSHASANDMRKHGTTEHASANDARKHGTTDNDTRPGGGRGIVLMGNLHTTEVMLRGKPADVERAAKQAIDDAAEGGGFILSTGDQCPRDTPEENLHALIETAHTYGKY
jgi:uroporphyrinogen decarboxylase